MVHLADMTWLLSRLESPDITVVDPRSRTRYLSGHLPNALSVPVTAAFGSDGRLLTDAALAEWLGRSGVSSEGTVVAYGDTDGQSAAMLAWIVEYLGHPDVAVLGTRFEGWKSKGGEVFYRPVAPSQKTFVARPHADLRADWNDALKPGAQCVLDVRSQEEYRGEKVIAHDDLPGHIPGALNVPWLGFVGADAHLIAEPNQVEDRILKAGAKPDHGTIVYGRSGCTRASVAWLALRLAGLPARMYDGSFLDWSQRSDLPIERGNGSGDTVQ